MQELGFKGMAKKKFMNMLVGVKRAEQEQHLRVKWFLRFLNVSPGSEYHPVAIDIYLHVLQRLLPLDQFQQRLEDEPYQACLISYSAMAKLLEDGLVNRLFETPDQRTQMLAALSITESATLMLMQQQQQLLHVDDVLDAIMNAWYRYQKR